MEQFLSYTKEVEEALHNNQPVVALESTIISHGLPFPQNLEMARKVETIIREQGAVPATIGIMDGQIKIGLTEEELNVFATSENVHKVSRRDFAHVIAQKELGATTVAGTMIAAELAGIKVFATGGIGGVHREGEITWDVSADLTELAQTNVAVVCAGAKSILDIGRTLEYLETHGVPVIGYKTNTFPSFYSRVSEFGVDYQIDEPKSVAKSLKTKWDLGLEGGAIVANPVPKHAELDYNEIEHVIEEAITEAKDHNITGKEVTPFILDKVKSLTDGQSLETNLALVYHNAEVAGQVAKAYKEV
ncbi:pseudouridine-5'-phosphate glycosidase [Alkalibacillus haloalkaliphilus]|uniref:pseudouridine-5'-phosphate glycosidase n=1 Tax=Alkalibacillus haloalkaliphilus TaxID=94136 RepID=UPI002935DCD9|nr:pseudouridine-5'-phosphate glycosidase [Alkalibacillus haloalkaliphilus]MDV2581469.1 pseudouridine-5'-phosphate glycosidase [Alkalibacillus haloalkaliphilus]